MIVQSARTRDGQWRIFLHEDQTAELTDARGKTIIGRSVMYVIGKALAERDIDPADLVPE